MHKCNSISNIISIKNQESKRKFAKLNYFLKISKIICTIICYIIIINNTTFTILLKFLIFKAYYILIAFLNRRTARKNR